jgi:hypothetical protein
MRWLVPPSNSPEPKLAKLVFLVATANDVMKQQPDAFEL